MNEHQRASCAIAALDDVELDPAAARPVFMCERVISSFPRDRSQAYRHVGIPLVNLSGWDQPDPDLAPISLDAVQDCLKSIFDRVGVRSRRELVAQLFSPALSAMKPQQSGMEARGVQP